MLREFIALHREEIIARCRAKVAARSVPPPTTGEIDTGVPLFLDQLRDALDFAPGAALHINDSAAVHGHTLLLQGFTVSQVVHDYGDVCQSITELAGERSVGISVADFQMLNRSLDVAIAAAVTQYGREHRESTAGHNGDDETQQGQFLTHEVRNLVNTALLAFDVLQTGNVGVSGSTGAVLHRSLMRLRALISRSLAAIRLAQGVRNHERFLVSEFVDDLKSAAGLEAHARGVTLDVRPVGADVAIEADRQVLAAAVGNILQNAFKFTRHFTTVVLRVNASDERVKIEVEDECGGLGDEANSDGLFQPFEQRSTDRSGLGLGLSFCRQAVEDNGGRVYVRSLTGKGCIFTVDMPRAMLPAAMAV